MDAGQAAEQPVGRGVLVLAATAGFTIGGCVVGLLWSLSAAAAASDAARDARDACAALERVGELDPDVSGGAGAGPYAPGLLHRVSAARELAAAAASGSDLYLDLADHIDGVSRMVLSLNLADPAGRYHLRQAQQICART
jgi:hypothetical protein